MFRSTHSPENWIVLKINHHGETTYKVFGEWRGSYTEGDAWRMNSGIVSCREEDGYYVFGGYSGSEYRCMINRYGIRGMFAIGILNQIIDQVKEQGATIRIVDENTDFVNKEWSTE